MNDDRVDVLVIGSGIAGLSAAVAAKEQGAGTVIVLEATEIVGGASRLSEGILVGAGMAIQAASGIEDSADLMYTDYQNVNQWGLDAGLARRLAEESGPTVDWLAGLGAEFNPAPVKGGYESVPRCAVAVGRGQGVIDALARRAKSLGVDVLLRHRADRLLLDGTAVVGAVVDGQEIRAAAVVVATGGFGANSALLREHYPAVAQFDERTWYIGESGSQGDAIALGRGAGASIVGEGNGLSMLTPGFTRSLETYLPGWLVVTDPSGRRFLPENAHYSVLDCQARLRGGRFFAIFDSAALDPVRSQQTPFYAGGSKGYPGREERRSANWNPTILQEMRAEHRILESDTIGGLAAMAGIPVAQLEATIAEYNSGAAAGRDRLGKPEEFLRPIESGPFFAAPLEHALVVVTGTGIQIDPEARAVDPLGRAIPGLYAAGEASGGVWGAFYPSSGSSLGSAATLGRIAGRAAAAFASSRVPV